MKIKIALGLSIVALALTGNAQLTLTGNSYSQNFNSVGSGLPVGWSVRISSSNASFGLAATFGSAPTNWAFGSGSFNNVASVTNDLGVISTGSETATVQAAYTNRQIGIKQSGTAGYDPGAGLVFQIQNTAGYSNLQFSVDFTMLNNQTRETVWTVDYGIGASPTVYTVLGTYTNTGSFAATARPTYNLGSDANNQSDIVTIRIAALAPTTSTGSRDMFGVDNFYLTYAGSAIVLPPTITTQPASRVNLTNTTAMFKVVASGPGTLSYQWRRNGVNLVNGGGISGADTNNLLISGVTSANEGNYDVIVSNGGGSVTSTPPATLTLASSGTLTRWKFNGTLNTSSPVPSEGDAAATAALSGNITGFSQPAGSGNDFDSPNTAWGTSTYPVNGASNKLAGPRFNVSTAGKKNITVSYDTRASTTASRFTRLQYTANGTDFIDAPTSFSLTTGNIYETRTYDLTGFPGVRDNPNFGVRIAAEFESTASYGASANSNFVGVSSTYATSGTVSYDLVTVNADVISDASLVPTISSVANFSITDDAPATNINITIGDGDTADASLIVTAVSSNTAVLFDPSTSGTTSTRTLQITPQAGQTGVVPILVKVTDPEGNAAVTWFYVTVTPGNPAPTISSIPNTNTLVNTPITLPFTVNDVGTPVASLILSSNSENTSLVANTGISITGTAPNYSVTVAPNTGSNGIAVIALTVTDGGGKSATSKFALMVRPSTNVVLIDGFDYPTGPITTASVGLYATHSGTPLQMDVFGGLLNVTDGETEDVNAKLVGAPFLASQFGALYSSFVVNFSSLPTFGGGYFAHFKDDGTANLRDRIYASTLDAVPGTYRLGTGNTSGTTNFTAQYPMDLQLGSNYLVVTRLVVSNGLSTVWINPTNELTDGVTDNSVVASPSDITTFAFRQAPEIGTMTLDNLRVGTSFEAVTGIAPSVPTPVALTINQSGADVVLTWTDPTGLFKLATGTEVTGITNVVATTSPYTNTVSGQRYFRLVYP